MWEGASTLPGGNLIIFSRVLSFFRDQACAGPPGCTASGTVNKDARPLGTTCDMFLMPSLFRVALVDNNVIQTHRHCSSFGIVLRSKRTLKRWRVSFMPAASPSSDHGKVNERLRVVVVVNS